MIRRPGLLAADLSETARLEPIAASLTLKMIGAGEAALTLAEDAPTVHVHDWVSMYTGQGLAGIFRVTNVAQTYRRQIEVSLLHGIDILSDSVWAAQTTFTGTKAAFLTQLLNQQTQLINGVKPWQLGRCEDSGSIERDINYDRLSTLLEALEVEGSNYYFVYDQTTWPWTIHYVAKANTVSSEFRLTRNIRTATVTYNDADLCTRLYLSVSSKNEGTVTVKKANPNYISDEATPGVPALVDTNITVSSTDSAVRIYDNTAAQAVWGIVVKPADIDTHDDIQEQHFPNADAWAANYLALRAEPSVQIQIDGDTLRELTGNEWDESDIGALCQVALPEYGHTFREYVVTVTYPDLVRDESHVTISLANTLPKVSESIAMARSEAKTAARASRATARTAADAKEVTSWSQIVKYQGDALDGTGVLTLYESGISMDATGGVKIYSLSEGLQGLYSEVKVNAEEIYAESQKISLVIKDGAIDAGSIVGAINNQRESIVIINADRVNIDGQKSVKISDVLFIAEGGAFWVKRNATFGQTAGNLVTINNGTVNAPTIQVNSGGSLTFSPSTQSDSALSLTRAKVANLVTDVQISGPVNNVYTLQYKKIGTGDTWNNASVTFSRATSLSGRWSGRNYIVTATPQNETKTGIVYDGIVPTGSITKTGKTVKRDFIVYSDDGEGNADQVILQKTLSISASEVYDDGWDAAYRKVSWPASGTGNSFIEIAAPISTVDGAADLRRFILRNHPSNNNAVLISTLNSQNQTYTDYAMLTHNKYTAGQQSVTVTAASIQANLDCDPDEGTASGIMEVRLSNMNATDPSIELPVDLSTVYQAGLNGDTPISTADFEFDLTDGSTTWSGFFDDVDVSAAYEQGVEDATPAVLQTYTYDENGDVISTYIISSSSTTFPEKTDDYLFPNTPVNVGQTHSIWTNFVYVTYNGKSGWISKSKLIDSTSTTPSPTKYQGQIGWKTILPYPYTSYVMAASGSTVWIRRSESTGSAAVVAVPVGATIMCMYDPYGYPQNSSQNRSWMPVKYGSYTGYMMTQYIAETQEYYRIGVGADVDSEFAYVTRAMSPTENSVPMYVAASTSSGVILNIPNDKIVYCSEAFTDYQGDWMHVKYANTTGYVQAKYIRGTLAYKQEQQDAAERIDIFVTGVYTTEDVGGAMNFAQIVVYYTHTNSGFDTFILRNSKAACDATSTNYNSNANMIREIASDDERLTGKTLTVVFSDGTTVRKACGFYN